MNFFLSKLKKIKKGTIANMEKMTQFSRNYSIFKFWTPHTYIFDKKSVFRQFRPFSPFSLFSKKNPPIYTIQQGFKFLVIKGSETTKAEAIKFSGYAYFGFVVGVWQLKFILIVKLPVLVFFVLNWSCLTFWGICTFFTNWKKH